MFAHPDVIRTIMQALQGGQRPVLNPEVVRLLMNPQVWPGNLPRWGATPDFRMGPGTFQDRPRMNAIPQVPQAPQMQRTFQPAMPPRAATGSPPAKAQPQAMPMTVRVR